MIVTGGHGDAVDHLFDGSQHIEIPVVRHDVPRRTARAARTRRRSPHCSRAARRSRTPRAGPPRAASAAVGHGLAELGAGDGPVDVFNLKGVAR